MESLAHEQTRRQLVILRQTAMANGDELRLHDALLQSLVEALNLLLDVEVSFEENIHRAFALLGAAVDVDRVYFFEISDDGRMVSLRHEWTRDGIEAFIDDPRFQNFNWEEGFGRWKELLLSGGVVAGDVASFPDHEQAVLQAQGILSLVVAPCRVGGRVRGFIGFDMCRELREWRPEEIRILTGVSHSIGMALERGRALKELDAFAQTVAHELKSPLGTIAGVAGLLLDACNRLSEAERDELLATLMESSRRAVSAVDELLRFAGARLEPVRIGPVDLHQILATVLQRMEDEIDEANAVVLCENRLPVALAHGPWMEEVFTNLIGNALKYGGSPPEIIISSRPLGNQQLEVSVCDHGPGIPEELGEEIFKPFFRHDPHGRGGNGLGLSIVRRMIERFGGITRAANLERGGARFFFTLREAGSPEG